MEMVDQNKGKDLKNVAKSKLIDGPYYLSIKRDGHYVQIKYDINTDQVQFWTSGGKPFYLAKMADYIRARALSSFHIECEFNYGCDGKLGDRGKSAILTTYRTNYEKEVYTPGDETKDFFTVLDSIDLTLTFETRLRLLQEMFFTAESWFILPRQDYVATIAEAEEVTTAWVKQGWEGGMLKHPKHMYQPGKRVNNIIKLKPRLTADLLCIGTEGGKGKYEGLIGSLVLVDAMGRQVSAGSGLSDYDRQQTDLFFIDKVVEIEYEKD